MSQPNLVTFHDVALRLIDEGEEITGQVFYSLLVSHELEGLTIAKGVARALSEIDLEFSRAAWKVCNSLIMSEIEAAPLQGPFSEPDPEFS